MNIAGQFPPYTPAIDNDPSSGTLSMLQVRDFLGREWRLIALITGLSIVVGATYVAISPYKYTAQSDMIIDTKRVTWTQTEMASENRTVEDASVESEIETTKSEKVAEAVIRRLHLTEDPEFVGAGSGLRRRIFSLFKLGSGPEQEPSNDELMRRVVGSVKDNLRVTRLGRSYIEQIAYTSLDRDKAAKIANAFADAYIEDQLQAKFEATRRASAWLEQRIGELRQQASNAYKEVQDFKSENSIIIGVDGKLASEVEIAKSQEESIDKRMIEVFQKSASTRQSQVHLRELETAANTYRGIYETFLSRFTQSVQQQSFPSTEARVVTVATPPNGRSSPKINLTIALATLAGLCLGIMA